MTNSADIVNQSNHITEHNDTGTYSSRCVLPKAYPTFNHCLATVSGILPIDYFLAKSLISDCTIAKNIGTNGYSQQHFESDSAVIFHAILSLSMNLREGHTCIPLTALASLAFGEQSNELGDKEKVGYLFPEHTYLTKLFEHTNFFQSTQNPIVYSSHSLYLRRYYVFENNLQALLKSRVQQVNYEGNTDDIRAVVATLFPKSASELESTSELQELDWQKIAVINALNKRFSVIAGGPGTGKTYTVTKLLAALVMLNNQAGKPEDLNIALVAPTGKAAQRLSESLVDAIEGFKSFISTDVLEKIPTQAQTIHRLLGVIPEQPHFRHNAQHLLTCDVLLVDEVSMVDLPLMQRLLSALPESTQVILLGDADQLPSVEVGSVLSDIAPRPYPGFSAENHAYLSQIANYTDLPKAIQVHADHCVFLTKSRRFDGKGGIGLLAQAVIAGDSESSWQLLHEETHEKTLSYLPTSSTIDPLAQLLPLVKKYYSALFSAPSIDECFNALARFRFLCATRKGLFGVESLNEEIERYLLQLKYIPVGKNLYHGKPIMISRNHYGLGLYNGDVGVVWLTDSGTLQVAFEKQNGEYMWVLPSKLPEYEAVYAMTIHKTQGSEFSHVAMVLPEQADNKLLSRELLYTGITRAKKTLSITCHKNVWKKAVTSQVKRFSNLSLSTGE